MRLLKLVLLLFLTQRVTAQIKVTDVDKNTIPKSIQFKGHIVNAVKYTDSEGTHLVITTETGIVAGKDTADQMSNADLYAYCYKVEGNKLTLAWQMHDFFNDCPLEEVVNYIPGTFAVTDLNNDGKAEVWLMYLVACRSDVSPGSLKIIMHEGNKKYAMRGENRVNDLPNKYVGGRYTFDDAFKAGPKPFRDYAQQLWKKNMFYDK